MKPMKDSSLHRTAGLDQLGPVHANDVCWSDLPNMSNPRLKGLNERARSSTLNRGVTVTLIDHTAVLDADYNHHVITWMIWRYFKR